MTNPGAEKRHRKRKDPTLQHSHSRVTSRLALLAALILGALLLVPSAASAQRTVDSCPDDRAKVLSWSYDITRASGAKLDDVRDLTDNVQFGDKIVASFKLAPNCRGKYVTLASYRSISASGQPLSAQRLYDFDSRRFTNDGDSPRLFKNALRVSVFKPTTRPSASQTSDVQECQDQSPNQKGKGANTSGPYDPTCDGSPSENGKGDGNATGRPCAGCVGNADDKNPPGQMPDGSDNNAGYECDRNQGVGQTNPAHTGCKGLPFFQVDFATGPVIRNLSDTNRYGPDLIDYDNGPGFDQPGNVEPQQP